MYPRLKFQLLSPLPVIARAVKSPLHNPGLHSICNLLNPPPPEAKELLKLHALHPRFDRLNPRYVRGVGVSVRNRGVSSRKSSQSVRRQGENLTPCSARIWRCYHFLFRFTSLFVKLIASPDAPLPHPLPVPC